MRQAAALGLLHGPTDLAPISSSGHTTLLAWHRGWSYGSVDAAARKRFEVALHAGTIAALLIANQRGIEERAGHREAGKSLRHREATASLTRREAAASPIAVVALACVPAAIAGKLLAGPIERRLGTPATIAASLAGGAVAMAVADLRGDRERTRADAGIADGVALGAAQAIALIPGVSRSGATRAAARWRGFSPLEAEALSAAVGLPITLGALALKGSEALRSDRSEWGALGVGALAAFSSTLAGASAMRRLGRARSLLPYAGYRVAVAVAVVRRVRQNGKR